MLDISLTSQQNPAIFFSAVNAYAPLCEALGIPAAHEAFGEVLVGYTKLKYQRPPLRKEPRISWI